MLALREGRAEPALAESQIFVVDDDAMVREALVDLFGSVGLQAEAFPSTRAFLDAPRREVPSCLVLDVRMPEESGLDLQRRMNDQGLRVPIIFITGHADVPMSVRAMKLGAINFLPKPFRDQELLDAVSEALRQDAEQRAADAGTAELRKLAERLTPRELDVLKAVDRGLLNKQIAHELGIAEITVKMHRSSAFRKLKATTVVDMIQKVRALNLR
ncbi:two component transcriptional regulator, LuxR family [Sphingomonas sp. NFR04]|uniref:response regulator transcription factor n=1 Tax=Sphingomonas sp. NFR04 TaxID=1566283 RepID=UPI0008F08C34|nr:response regulator [Sphingomonas sp. NFR04]SFJ13226.1 two component transcriptional regulator, LuxR family [Sphingomonas sp. NFR04]